MTSNTPAVQGASSSKMAFARVSPRAAKPKGAFLELALERAFVSRSGLYCFFNDYFAEEKDRWNSPTCPQ